MLLLSRRIERPLDVPIERPQHADMRMLNPSLALAVPPGIFRRMPRLILPPWALFFDEFAPIRIIIIFDYDIDSAAFAFEITE